MIDIRQTSYYARHLKNIGWEVESINHIKYFIKKLPLFGSIIKVQRPEEIQISKIRELAKKYHTVLTIVEPKHEIDANFLEKIGFKKGKKPYLPTKTLHLELIKPLDDLFDGLKKDAKSILGKNQNLEIKNSKNTKRFRESWKKAVGFRRFVPSTNYLQSLKKSFKDNSLFLKTKDSSSGAIFLKSDSLVYYWQAFSSKKGREEKAQYKIVWEGILWAKKKGAKIFDFEGIYDKRFPDKSWLGFSHFKKSFGGNEVKYPGAFTKIRV